MNTLRTKYPYSLDDRSRDEDTNRLLGYQFPSISRDESKTAQPTTTPGPTADMADGNFQQIYLIIDNGIKKHIFISV